MIEQTWWNTPWYRIDFNLYITNGEALTVGVILLISFFIFVGFVFGKRRR